MGSLDEEKIATLRAWAEGLSADPRDELRAAAKAILLLIEELEAVHVQLWHARELAAPEAAAPETPPRPSLRSALAERLRTS